MCIRDSTDVLEFEGYEVVTHMLGRAGVREMKERGADLVILDLMLPDINGFQVCEEIRTENQVVPIIILTARGQELDKIRGLEAGADDYVTKPFSVGELLARIKAILRRLTRDVYKRQLMNCSTVTLLVGCSLKNIVIAAWRRRSSLRAWSSCSNRAVMSKAVPAATVFFPAIVVS